MISTYKDLTDALPSRIGRPNKFGVPPAYFDADIEPLIEEYAALFKIMQAPPASAQTSDTPFKDVVDLGTAIARAKGLDAATADAAGRISLALFFAETNGNQNIGNARSNTYKGSLQTGTTEDRNGRQEVGGDQGRRSPRLDPAVAARDDKEEARVGKGDQRYNHWTGVRNGLMNAHAELFAQIPAIVQMLPDEIDQMKFFELIQIVPTPTRAALELRRRRELQDFGRADHGIPAQQQHLHLRQDRPREEVRDLSRDPRRDVAVQRQVREGAGQVRRDQSRASKGREGALEPHVRDAASVAAQVVEADKPVEVIDDDGGDRLRFRQPQIDGDAAAAVLAGGQSPANGLRSRSRRKSESRGSGVPARTRGSAPTPGCVRFRSHRPRAPRSAGRPCNCRRSPTREPVKTPADRAAKTRPFDHPSSPSPLDGSPYHKALSSCCHPGLRGACLGAGSLRRTLRQSVVASTKAPGFAIVEPVGSALLRKSLRSRSTRSLSKRYWVLGNPG